MARLPQPECAKYSSSMKAWTASNSGTEGSLRPTGESAPRKGLPVSGLTATGPDTEIAEAPACSTFIGLTFGLQA